MLQWQIQASYTVEDPNIFDRLRMLIDFDIQIPAELVSLSVTLLDNKVQLSWSTATETNNSGFEIQRTSPLPSHLPKERVAKPGELGDDWFCSRIWDYYRTKVIFFH
ncbi:MAG: hypothetical protein MZV64_01910 [Ignavibacteriales bacterium]|nr:hypothetical protein [Ignavibacteriales bacterium]